MPHAVVLFTRTPLPGKTKTRMMPFLTGRQTARLHAAVIRDIAGQVQLTGQTLLISCTPARGSLFFSNLAERKNIFFQKGRSTAERLMNCAHTVRDRGFSSFVVLVSDCPGITRDILVRAGDLLKAAERTAVYGLSYDGGMYLLGLNDWQDLSLLKGVPWGQVDSTEILLARLRSAGFSLVKVPVVGDLDEPKDLQRLVHAAAADTIGYVHTRQELSRILRRKGRDFFGPDPGLAILPKRGGP